jgi:uncharacterized protein (TIGR02722 family)
LALTFISCASSGGRVVRVDSRGLHDTDANYGAEDLHLFTQKMVNSMLQSSFLNDSKKPYIALGEIVINKGVDEHIDVRLIKNVIRTNLIKSNKISFIDSEHIKELEKQLDYQNSSRYMNKNTIKKVGGFIARDYTLIGDIHAIKKDNGDMIDNFYALSLRLTDAKTSAIVWSEEKEIRKQKRK